MNEKIEKAIVSLYITERKADRILYELSHPKKREQCIWMLSRYFGEDVVTVVDKHKAGATEIIRRMREHGYHNEQCYLLSVNSAVDGTECTLSEALSKADAASPMLVYCAEHKIAYWQGEEELSDTERMILYKG